MLDTIVKDASVLDKQNEIQNVGRHMESLYSISEMLGNSEVKKIEVTQTDVLYTLEFSNYTAKFCKEKEDMFSFLNGFIAGYHDNLVFDALMKYICEGDVVFDIGANIGLYSVKIPIAKHATVYSFEPVLTTFNNLRKNLKLNNLKEEYAFNIGFSNVKKEDMEFFVNPKSSGSSSMKDLKYVDDGCTKKMTCKLETMDDFVNTNKIVKLDFIKCDVEGAELLVYQGAVETIQKFRPIILSEMLRKWSKLYEYHPNDIIAFFREKDYSCYALNSKGVARIEFVDEDTMETNYLFIPDEKMI